MSEVNGDHVLFVALYRGLIYYLKINFMVFYVSFLFLKSKVIVVIKVFVKNMQVQKYICVNIDLILQ